MKKINRYYMLAMLSLLSFSCVLPAPTDPWWQRAWHSIRPYFGWIVGGSATGAAAGAGIAHRYKMNPCVGAACGAVAGGLLVGGGSALLASRIDKAAEEYVQNLSNLLHEFTVRKDPNIPKFLKDDHASSLIKVLLANKYNETGEYNKARGNMKIVALIRPWEKVRDKVSKDTFNSFIKAIQDMLTTLNSAESWASNIDLIFHINYLMTGDPLVSNNYFSKGGRFVEYNIEHMNELIEKIGELHKN